MTSAPPVVAPSRSPSPKEFLGPADSTVFTVTVTLAQRNGKPHVTYELEVHQVCDHYGTHQSPIIVKWIQAHPRFHMHTTATHSSWINLVEWFFAHVTAHLFRRSDHRSIQVLEADTCA